MGNQVGETGVYGGNQVRKVHGNQYLDMEMAIEFEVADTRGSTATAGLLHVLQFMAQNHWDMVAECDGQDGAGEWIVCFIIIAHKLVTHPQDIINGSGHFAVLQQYLEVSDTSFFLICAKGANLLNTPSSLLPTDYVN
jgi:hypothetical protein